MRVNHERVGLLTESWINGNKGVVRSAVKSLTKLEFYFLMTNITSLSNEDEERTAHNLVGNL